MTIDDAPAMLAAQWCERLSQLLAESLAQSLATPFCDALIDCGRDAQLAIELARSAPQQHRATALVDCAEALWRASDKRATKVALEGLRSCNESSAHECLRAIQSFVAVEPIQKAAHKKVASWSSSRRTIDVLAWAEAVKLRLSAERFLSEDRGAVRRRGREIVAVVAAKRRYDGELMAFATLCAELARIDALDGDTEGASAHFEMARAELEQAKNGVEVALSDEHREREVAYACALRSLLDAANALADTAAIDACARLFIAIQCGSLSSIPATLASLKLPEAPMIVSSASHLWLDAMRECSDRSLLEQLRKRAGTPSTIAQIEEHYADGLITTSERIAARLSAARIPALDGRVDEAREIVDALEREARSSLVATIVSLRDAVRSTLDRGAAVLPPLISAAPETRLDARALAERRASWAALAKHEGPFYASAGVANRLALSLLRHAACVALEGERAAARALVDEVAAPLDDRDDDRSKITRRRKIAVELLTAQVAAAMLDEAIVTSNEFAYVPDGQAPLPHLVDQLVRAGRAHEARPCVSAALAASTGTHALEHSLRAILRLAHEADSPVEAATIATNALDACETWARGARS